MFAATFKLSTINQIFRKKSALSTGMSKVTAGIIDNYAIDYKLRRHWIIFRHKLSRKMSFQLQKHKDKL